MYRTRGEVIDEPLAKIFCITLTGNISRAMCDVCNYTQQSQPRAKVQDQ